MLACRASRCRLGRLVGPAISTTPARHSPARLPAGNTYAIGSDSVETNMAILEAPRSMGGDHPTRRADPARRFLVRLGRWARDHRRDVPHLPRGRSHRPLLSRRGRPRRDGRSTRRASRWTRAPAPSLSRRRASRPASTSSRSRRTTPTRARPTRRSRRCGSNLDRSGPRDTVIYQVVVDRYRDALGPVAAPGVPGLSRRRHRRRRFARRSSRGSSRRWGSTPSGSRRSRPTLTARSSASMAASTTGYARLLAEASRGRPSPCQATSAEPRRPRRRCPCEGASASCSTS